MISRRRLLAAGTLLAAPVAAASFAGRDVVAWMVMRSSARLDALLRSPEQRLRAHFEYLNLDSSGIARYVADYQRYFESFNRHLPLSSDVYTRYLLSTDFFRRRDDPSQPIRYVGFYDPDRTPCNNPLARFDDEA